MRTIPRILLAVGTVASLSMTITPTNAHAAAPAALGSVTVGHYDWDDDGYGYGYGRYGYGDWRDESYGEYAGDGYYCKDCEDDMPLICREERYSCRAPRDWSVNPVVTSAAFGR